MKYGLRWLRMSQGLQQAAKGGKGRGRITKKSFSLSLSLSLAYSSEPSTSDSFNPLPSLRKGGEPLLTRVRSRELCQRRHKFECNRRRRKAFIRKFAPTVKVAPPKLAKEGHWRLLGMAVAALRAERDNENFPCSPRKTLRQADANADGLAAKPVSGQHCWTEVYVVGESGGQHEIALDVSNAQCLPSSSSSSSSCSYTASLF